MVGDYTAEEFDTGDGALVRDNAVFLIAALNLKFGFSPEDLTFHKECRIDNHHCPGHNVDKTDVVARVRSAMASAESKAPAVSDAIPSPRMLGITATVFGGDGDEQHVAYQDVAPGWPNRPGVALPSRFSGPRPKVRISMNTRSAVCDIVDVGPWFPSARGPEDRYWQTGERPRAESDDRTNRAGIDLTPAAARAVGLNGKGIIDWEFIMADVIPVRPTADPTIADLSKRIDRLEAIIGNKTPPLIRRRRKPACRPCCNRFWRSCKLSSRPLRLPHPQRRRRTRWSRTSPEHSKRFSMPLADRTEARRKESWVRSTGPWAIQ
jgi:hypothetical protein